MGRKTEQTFIIYFYFCDGNHPMITDVITDEVTAKDRDKAFAIGKKLIPHKTIPGFIYLNHICKLKEETKP